MCVRMTGMRVKVCLSRCFDFMCARCCGFKQQHNGVVFSRVRAQVLLQLRVPQQRGHVVQRKVVVPAAVHAKGVRRWGDDDDDDDDDDDHHHNHHACVFMHTMPHDTYRGARATLIAIALLRRW